MPASFAAKGVCQTPGIVENPWLWPCPLSGSCTLLLENSRSEHKTTAATKDHQRSTERKNNLIAKKALPVYPQIFGCKSIECIFCIILLDLVTPTFFFPFVRYSWRHQLREFKSEYRVVALDLRGYGETDAPPHKENYKLDCLIADIKDILESLGALVEEKPT